MNAYLILEDGTVFKGESIGSEKTSISEVVFNTSMTGYLEVLTDPSYAGQAVVMTYPLIGNYGVTPDQESDRAWVGGYIVHELSRTPSNFRCQGRIQDFLKEQDIPGICGIDTRCLTKMLRDKGTMNGMITTDEAIGNDPSSVLEEIKAYSVSGVIKRVSVNEKTILAGKDDASLPGIGLRVALLDLGAKRHIHEELNTRGCEVTVWPAYTKADEIIADKPDGIMLTNGPGDPKEEKGIIEEIKKLYDSGIPIFAICLGHQMTALATGADTRKLKYGHRGGNHPVKDLKTNRVYITSQNHGYVVDPDSLDSSVCEAAYVNVNDGTNEGLIYKQKNVITVQFHPEACPGPHDSDDLFFNRFISMMRK